MANYSTVWCHIVMREAENPEIEPSLSNLVRSFLKMIIKKKSPNPEQTIKTKERAREIANCVGCGVNPKYCGRQGAVLEVLLNIKHRIVYRL